ncbi:MAG: hypothetical protein HY703_07995 [Gemmatimonadetes bacterium]|nr:hypothetical protein [Gemmatimonadota bacterium]
MALRLKADGATWEARIARDDPHPGVRAVVFYCITNPQRPWRVAELPADRLDSTDGLASLSRAELKGIFAQADPMDFAHDPTSDPGHPGGHPLPGRPRTGAEPIL